MNHYPASVKISTPVSNDFCPQTLFVYGTWKEDGTPNFGLFCWFSYCWDGGLSVMASLGGPKLTRDRIRATGVFSANLVTEDLLPLADYFGNTEGYSAVKMNIPVAVERGAVLDVPVLAQSPVTFELAVTKTVELEGNDLFICKIRNVLAAKALTDAGKTPLERLQAILPARTTCETYFSWDGRAMGKWGEPMHSLQK